MSRRVNQFTRCRRVSSYIPISRDSPGGPENQPKPTAYFTKAASVSAEAREQGDYARWFGLTLLTGSSATAWGWATSAPWILFFTLIGTFFLLASHQGSENLSAKAIFSLDRLLPIVQLEETSKEVEAGLAGRVKYFYIDRNAQEPIDGLGKWRKMEIRAHGQPFDQPIKPAVVRIAGLIALSPSHLIAAYRRPARCRLTPSSRAPS